MRIRQLAAAGTAVAACAAIAVSVTGAAAPATATATAAPAPSVSNVTTAPAPGSPTVQTGFAATCNGESGGQSVSVELYQNSGSPDVANVAIETADGMLVPVRGAREPQNLFAQGRIHTTVALERRGEHAPSVPMGRAAVGGTYELTGPITTVNDEFDDAGEHTVVKGTNQALKVKLTVSHRGERIPVTCGEAFAFDLKTWKTPIG